MGVQEREWATAREGKQEVTGERKTEAEKKRERRAATREEQ